MKPVSSIIFHEGLEAIYDNYVGIINFVGSSYLTLCVKYLPEEKVRNVCIVIYKDEFNKIKLLKESSK
jgi:hypothetical protein